MKIKFDRILDDIREKDTGSSPPPPAGACEIEDILHADLLVKLTAGTADACHYRITDFKTVHIIPGSLTGDVHFGETEPLMVTPSSPYTLQLQAWSENYPDDIIHYEITDTSQANPNNGTSKGRIIYRKNTTQNITCHYDFRNGVFYRPITAYSLSSPVFPVTVDSIVINGTAEFLGASVNSIDDLVAYLRNVLVSQWVIVEKTSDTTFIIWSKNGYEYGDLTFTDNESEVFVTGELDPLLWYTFGNDIEFFNFSFVPAPDGHQIADTFSVYMEGIIEWQQYPFNNILFGINAVLIHISSQSYDSIISNSSYLIEIGSNCTDILIKDTAYLIILAHQCFHIDIGRGASNCKLGQSCSGISVGLGCVSLWFEMNCFDITIGYLCGNIIFGVACYGILIANGNLFLRFGTQCTQLSLGYNNYIVEFGDNCVNISVSDNNNDLKFGSNCFNIAIGENNITLRFGSSCATISIGINN